MPAERREEGPHLIDFFCGAGGFSEGFGQLDFDVMYAVDNWSPAIKTFKLNHPHAKIMAVDARVLPVADIPKADVIVGGPPCTEFSSSRPGGGDFQRGLELVYKFFYFIHKLRPKWWIMESVPRLLQVLPQSLPLTCLGINEAGVFRIPKVAIYNAADFGVPQARSRVLLGRYPEPTRTHAGHLQSTLDCGERAAWIPMKDIIDALPSPFRSPERGRLVWDPLYDIALDESELQDHFGVACVLTEEEMAKNKLQKTSHPYFGKMMFPDMMQRPARTVIATQIKSARETIVICQNMKHREVYRRLTVRECASLQGFPIDYKFDSRSLATKYKLVGNSVPVGLSRAIAASILSEEAKSA